MKKIVLSLLSLVMILGVVSNSVSAKSKDVERGQYPTANEIEQINNVLDRMIDEANGQVEAGHRQVEVTEEIKGEKIILGVGKTTDRKTLSKTDTFYSHYDGQEYYYAYVENRSGYNFKHELGGWHKYAGGKNTGATANHKLTGWAYTESAKTWINSSYDPSVWIVYSNGVFRAWRYGMEYNTYLTIRLYGSGDYRVTRSEITY